METRMEELCLGRWKVKYDSLTTGRAYRNCIGSPEVCGCDECRNFAAARKDVYPPRALELFGQLGINWHCEAEVYYGARIKPGLHLYAGWFHFVGSIESGADAMVQVREGFGRIDLEPLNERFALGFTSQVALVRDSFEALPLVQLEFEAAVPWVLETPEPDH